MWDNSQNITKIPNRRRRIRRLVLLLTVAVLAIAVLVLVLFSEALNLDALRRWFRYLPVRNEAGYGSFSYTPHEENCYALVDDGLAVATVDSLRLYGEDGSLRTELPLSTSQPKLESSEDLAMLFDVGGTQLTLVQPGKGELLRLSTDGSFFDADLASSGALCTAASASGYKAVLRVYDADQQEIYRRFSTERFFSLCAVSDNASHAAAVSPGQSGGDFISTLHIYATNSEEDGVVVSLDDALVYDLHFSGDRLCVLLESGLRWYGLDGRLLGEYSLDDAHLTDFVLTGDGFVLLTVNMYQEGEQYALVSVEENGTKLGRMEIGGELLDSSACGRYIAVLTPQTLRICRRDLQVYAETPNTWLATGVQMREDGTAIVTTGGSAALYIP